MVSFAHRAAGRAVGAGVMLFVAAVTVGTVLPAAATFSGTNGKLVFFDDATGSSKTMNADGGGLAELGQVHDVAYSSDGTRIAFIKDFRVYVAKADGSGVTPVTTHPAGASLQDRTPVWAAGDTRLIFSRFDDGTETTQFAKLYAINLNGTGMTMISPPVPQDETVFDERAPAVSPAGTRIAFVRETGSESLLMSVGVDGSSPATVSLAGVTAPEDPSWSPDGTQLALEGNGTGIFVVDSDGGTPEALANATGGENPVWSPDGTKIAYIRVEPGTRTLITSDADGDNDTAVTEPDVRVFGGEWQGCSAACDEPDYDADDVGGTNLDDYFGTAPAVLAGVVRSSATNAALGGASVRLRQVPLAEPGEDCLVAQTEWTTPPPPVPGFAPAQAPEISPAVNPRTSTAAGEFSWQVARGCWYVTVSKPHFVSVVGPLVGVPPGVTNLGFTLQPVVYSRTATLAARIKTQTYGNVFNVTGRLAAVAGAPTSCRGGVPVRITKDGTNVKTITSRSDGTFSTTVRAVSNGRYRAVVNASTHCTAATSSALRLWVAKRLTLSASDTRVPPGGTVRLTTTVSPAAAGDVITLLKKTSTGLRQLATDTTDATGTAVFRRVIHQKTTFVTRSEATARYVAGRSPTRTVDIQ